MLVTRTGTTPSGEGGFHSRSTYPSSCADIPLLSTLQLQRCIPKRYRSRPADGSLHVIPAALAHVHPNCPFHHSRPRYIAIFSFEFNSTLNANLQPCNKPPPCNRSNLRDGEARVACHWALGRAERLRVAWAAAATLVHRGDISSGGVCMYVRMYVRGATYVQRGEEK